MNTNILSQLLTNQLELSEMGQLLCIYYSPQVAAPSSPVFLHTNK